MNPTPPTRQATLPSGPQPIQIVLEAENSHFDGSSKEEIVVSGQKTRVTSSTTTISKKMKERSETWEYFNKLEGKEGEDL